MRHNSQPNHVIQSQELTLFGGQGCDDRFERFVKEEEEHFVHDHDPMVEKMLLNFKDTNILDMKNKKLQHLNRLKKLKQQKDQSRYKTSQEQKNLN